MKNCEDFLLNDENKMEIDKKLKFSLYWDDKIFSDDFKNLLFSIENTFDVKINNNLNDIIKIEAPNEYELLKAKNKIIDLILEYLIKRNQVNDVYSFLEENKIVKKKIMRILPENNEFKEVEKLFRKSIQDVMIIKIEKVENNFLNNNYLMNNLLIYDSQKTFNIKKMFYGNKSLNPYYVSTNDLTFEEFCQENAPYEKAIHFSDKASYMDNFAFIDKHSNLRQIFLADVIVGEERKVKSSEFSKVPFKEKGKLSFSCMGGDSKILLLFDHLRFYFNYIITYSKFDN